jgi:hypothetical protein
VTPGAPLRIAHGFGSSRELLRTALKSRVDVIETDVHSRGESPWLGHEHRLPLPPILLGGQPVDRPVRAHHDGDIVGGLRRE